MEFIQGRYAWFPDEMLGSQDSGKQKGQRKIPLAEQIAKANLSSFVIDASLGENKIVDLPSVEVQYLIRAKDAEKLRDKALSEYELVQDDDRLWIIAKLKQDLNEK